MREIDSLTVTLGYRSFIRMILNVYIYRHSIDSIGRRNDLLLMHWARSPGDANMSGTCC